MTDNHDKNPEASRAKRAKYWKTRKQISTVIYTSEHDELLPDAIDLNLTVGQLAWAQSKAYRRQEFIPPQVIIARLDEIRRLLRSKSNSLNQIAKHSNTIHRLLFERQTIKIIMGVETDIVSLVKKPWDHPYSHGVEP